MPEITEKYTPSQYALEVTEDDVVYVDRTHPQASEIKTHALVPGSYPFKHQVTNIGVDRFKGRVLIDSKLVAHTSRGVTDESFVEGQNDCLYLNLYTHTLENALREGNPIILGGVRIGTVRRVA